MTRTTSPTARLFTGLLGRRVQQASARRGVAGLAAATLLVAGCGDTDTADESATDAPQQSDGLVIDVKIEAGEVSPTNERLQGKVGEPIVIQVDSDAADELHVHAVPDHTFAVEPRPGQSFEFTTDVPGNVEIELHDLNRTIATVLVQQ